MFIIGFDLKVISDFIATLGFPILVALILLKNNDSQNDEHREDIKEMNNRYQSILEDFRTEIKSLNKTIENNTSVMVQLLLYVKGGDGENE